MVIDNDILSANALAPSIRFPDVVAAAASPFPRETTPQEQQACDDLLYLFLTITSNKLYIFIRFRKWKKEKTLLAGNARRACDPREFVKCIFVYYTHTLLAYPEGPFCPASSLNIDSGTLYELLQYNGRKQDNF